MTAARRIGRASLGVFDVLLIAGIVLVPILAWRGIRIVELGLLPLLVLPFMWRSVGADRRDWLMLALVAQYCALVAFNVLVYPAPPGSEGDAASKVLLYLGSAVGLLVLILRFRQAIDVAAVWRFVAPAGVLISVALLGWDHFTTAPPDHCRVGFLSKHLLIPPLWMTVFAVASYAGWSRLTEPERWLRHVALGLTVLATVAFSGGRAMLAAQALTIPILALLLEPGAALRRRIAVLATLGSVSLAGFLGGLTLDYRADCKFAERLIALAQTALRAEEATELAQQNYADRFEDVAPEPSEVAEAERSDRGQAGGEQAAEPDSGDDAQMQRRDDRAGLDLEERLIGAVWVRPMMWREAIRLVGQSPLTGYGYLNESELVTGGFPHFHQQYLSWLIWGGPLMLASGLALLFGPLATFGVRRSRDGAILALAMIAPLAVSFLAATNLLHTVMVMGYVMTLALLYAVARALGRDT